MKPVSCNRCNSYDMAKGTNNPVVFDVVEDGVTTDDGTVVKNPVIVEKDPSLEHWTCRECGYITILKDGVVINKLEESEVL